MKAVVLYESMYGNTRQIAEAITNGLAASGSVTLASTVTATPDDTAGADLVVVGGPTHAWSMSRPKTRQAAVDGAGKAGSDLVLEPGASGRGVREWLGAYGNAAAAAAFDTRLKLPSMVTGSAARAIRRQLRRGGASLLAPAQSFFVTKENRLLPGETERARRWGEELGSRFARRRNTAHAS